jgi:acylphosphatase
VVSGHVQGVWFRESCRREAEARSVAGWIANRADGAVEAVFEGREPDVAQVIAWCRIGPLRADVTAVDVTQEQPEGLVGFRVR